MNADLLKGFRTLLVNLIGIVFVYIHNRYPEIPIPGGVETDAIALCILNLLLRFITNTPIGKKTPGEEIKPLNTSGCVTDLAPLVMMLLMSVVLCVGTLLFQGCSTSSSTENKMYAARIIARHAGAYLQNKDPKTANEIQVAYLSIITQEGELYQKNVYGLLADLLAREGVQDSEILIADAQDLLAIFGVPVPTDPSGVTLDWVKQFDIAVVREIAEAFIRGANIDA